jgi:hypothetical protein
MSISNGTSWELESGRIILELPIVFELALIFGKKLGSTSNVADSAAAFKSKPVGCADLLGASSLLNTEDEGVRLLLLNADISGIREPSLAANLVFRETVASLLLEALCRVS